LSRRTRSRPGSERTEQEREHDRQERARRRAARAGHPPTAVVEGPPQARPSVEREPTEAPPAVASAHRASPSHQSDSASALEQPDAQDAPTVESPAIETRSRAEDESDPEAPSLAAEEPGQAPAILAPAAAADESDPEQPSPEIEEPGQAPAILAPDAAADRFDPVGQAPVAEGPGQAPAVLASGAREPGAGEGSFGIPSKAPPVEGRPDAVPPAKPLADEPPEPDQRAHHPDPVYLPPPRVRSAGPPARRARGRSPLARFGALAALAAAIAAVWLLLSSLGGSGHSSTATGPVVKKVVIPEGETRLQIAKIAVEAGLTGSYRDASKRSPLLNPARYGAPRGTRDLEGFLFPATYEMYSGAPARRLVDEQLVAFRQNFGPSEIARARALHVTPYQLLTVASMIEREANVARDRPLIAAVIYNRLSQGIPLGVDATIYYALALRSGIATYTQELTETQLQIDSPYNTRTHQGLPPTPISNPGLASIQAAAHPAHVPYLYYVVAADGCGEHVFSTSYAQFERDAAAYRAAVRHNGGRPPNCKRK